MDTTTPENQQEFFPDFVKPSERKLEPRAPGMGSAQKPLLLTTTIEQILFVSIVGILVLCAVYFLGILRGKAIASTQSAVVLQQRPIARPPTTSPVTNIPAAPAAVRRPSVNPIIIPTASAPAVPAANRPVRVQGLAAAAPAAVAAPIPGQRLYSIQVVTHKKRTFAEGELAAITKAGFAGKIIESDGYFVVCVGQYVSKEDAKKDLAFLKSKYADCFLRRL